MKFQNMTTVNQARDLWPDCFREASSLAPNELSNEAKEAGERFLGYFVPIDPASLTECDSCQ